MLKWNETDVLACLEVEPETDESGYLSYSYTVHKHDLTLKLQVWPMDGDILIDLFQKNVSDALFIMSVLDCPEIKYYNEKGKEWLEIAAGNCAQNRFLTNQDKTAYGIKLRINPSIQIETFKADIEE